MEHSYIISDTNEYNLQVLVINPIPDIPQPQPRTLLPHPIPQQFLSLPFLPSIPQLHSPKSDSNTLPSLTLILDTNVVLVYGDPGIQVIGLELEGHVPPDCRVLVRDC